MNRFIASALLIIISFGVNAQQLLVDSKPVMNEESKSVDAWVAHLDQDMNYCITTFNEFMRKNFDARTNKRSKNVYSVDHKVFSEISNLRIDLRAIFSQESNGTAVAFQFSPGYDIHFGVTQYNEEFDKAKALVKSYVRFHYKQYYEEQIKEVQSKIKSKEKSIASNDSKIEKNNKAMQLNAEDIAVNATGSDKLREKNEKMEKENAILQQENEKYKTDISQLEADIVSYKDKIALTETFN